MEFSLSTDDTGHLIATLADGSESTIVTASNVAPSGQELLAAIESARATGLGECVWGVPSGEYRWMFRREEGRLTVVVLWSHGTLTGWQHVFRADTDLDEFARLVRGQLRALEE